MSRSYNLMTYLVLSILVMGVNALPPSDSLHLVWKDHFNGETLDATKWAPAPEWFRQGASYWNDENYSLDGEGHLTLTVSEQNDSILAGAIRTHRLFDQTYGYFEVKCKLPQIKGGWAAFWMMPSSNKYGGWPKSGEIDIMEHVGYDASLVQFTGTITTVTITPVNITTVTITMFFFYYCHYYYCLFYYCHYYYSDNDYFNYY